MREWLVVIVGLLVFAGASVFALRGYRTPPPLAGLSATVQHPTGSNAPELDATGAPVTPAPLHSPAPTPEKRVNACVAGGVTNYTDQACPRGAVARSVTIADPNTYSPTPATDVDLSRYAPPASFPATASARSRSDDLPGPSQPGAECRTLEANIRTIDEAGRQGYSGSEGVRLTEERRRLRERYHELNCCTTC